MGITKLDINRAFIEDDEVRKAGIKRSEIYIDEKYKEENHIPYWIWALAWFAIGIIFSASFYNFNWIKYIS